MFKPSLKRSKLSQICISTSPSLPHRASILKQQAFTINKAQAEGLSIPQLFTKLLPIGPPIPPNRIVMPLTYCNLDYPPAVKEKLNQPIHHVKSRMIGSKFGVYWLLTQNQLYIWTYNSTHNPTEIRNCRKFQFEQNLRAIGLGHLDKQKCCLINTSDTCQTIAIGFESSIDLYTIDLKTLELNSMSIKFKMQFNQTLDKLEITDNNQILFTGDQGFLTRVVFDSQDKYGVTKISKQNARPNMFGGTNFWSSLKLSKTNTTIFTECILPSKDQKVYVLVRKQSQRSFLRKMSLAALRFLQGRIKNDEQSQIIQKQIHVYDVSNNNSKQLKFSFCISNFQIESKIRKSFGANEKISKVFDSDPNFNMASSIASIFLTKYKKEVSEDEQKLSIMTNYGLFLSIGFNHFQQGSNITNFSFDEQPKTLPQQLFQTNRKDLSNALFLKSKVSDNSKKQTQENYEFEAFAEKKSKLITSFGQRSLNILSNGLCFYFDQYQLQIVKLNKHPGFIAQSPIYSQSRQFEGNMWFVFSKSEITMIKKSQAQDCLLAGISAIDELEKQGVANGEKSQDYQFYTNMMIEQCCKIIGKTQVNNALCNLLLKISKIKVSELPILNNKGEVVINISNQAKQIIKQEMRIKIRALQRSKSAYNSSNIDQNIGLFSRWLIPKVDSIKVYQANISFDLEETVWKYFVLTSLENSNQRNFSNSNQTEGNKKLAKTSQFLIRYFQKYYENIKNLSMTELRRSPIKVKQCKNSLIALFNFLSTKRNKSYGLLQKLIYSRIENKQKVQKPKTDKQNLTMESLNSSTMPTLQSNTQQGTDKSWNPSHLGETMNYWRSQYSIEEIDNQLCSTITKLINVIELYEVLVSNSQSKYESLPNIHQFMVSLSAKKEVKAALLDLFSSACLYSDPTMLRFSQILPEMRLNADIYLAKWLKFVNLARTNQKQFDAKSTINAQLKISDLEQLSRKVELEQLIKVSHFFKQNCATYLNILINQLAFRTIQLEVINEFIKSSNEYKNKQTNETISIFDNLNSVFADDKLRANLEWKEWLSSQISLIRIEIGRYLQQLALSISESSPELYLIQQKQFDECVKALESCNDGPLFIKQVIDFLKQKSLLPQKVYRLSLLIKSKESKTIPGLFANVVRPQSMSTFQLLRTQMKKNRQQILGKQWQSSVSKKEENWGYIDKI